MKEYNISGIAEVVMSTFVKAKDEEDAKTQAEEKFRDAAGALEDNVSFDGVEEIHITRCEE